MSTVNKIANVPIPRRVDSGMLEKLGIPGEGRVIVKMAGIGNVAPYEFRGHDSRAFILRWEPKLGGHVLRVPLSLWMQNGHRMAHDILDHRRLEAPIVVMFEEGQEEVRESPTGPTSPTSLTPSKAPLKVKTAVKRHNNKRGRTGRKH